MRYTEVVVVGCSCGMFPLDKAMHTNSRSAWEAASTHKSLNYGLCEPNMHKELIPAGIVTK